MTDSKLSDLRDRLTFYSRALLGRDVDVLPLDALLEKELGWRDPTMPSTDGDAIYLPQQPPAHVPDELASTWFKLAATQQLAHFAEGSFHFEPSVDARPSVEMVGSPNYVALTGLSRYLAGFSDSWLAHELFAVLECARVEACNQARYPGLAGSYARLAELELSIRPPLETLDLRSAQVEEVLLASLASLADAPWEREADRDPPPSAGVPGELADVVAYWLRAIRDPRAQVSTTGDATAALHDRIIARDGSAPAGQARPPTHAAVSYRGLFKPELVQLRLLLEQRRATMERGRRGRGEPGARTTRAELRHHLEQSAAMTFDPEGAPEAVQRKQVVDNLAREWLDLDEAHAASDPADNADATGANATSGPGRSAPPMDPDRTPYDEWDYRSASYRRGHCGVRERTLPSGDLQFYTRTLACNHKLVQQVRRRLAAVPAESQRRKRRLLDGPTHDLDALVEAQIDRRSGHTPSERVFESKEREERSVAAVLLFDLSASTGEKLPQADGPGDPGRIIDVEKEALALLVDGLSTTQDAHAIYGFSGYRASQVDLFVLKEFSETEVETVARRIDGIRPQYATRMGAALRHATSKLEARPEKTRLLLLVSDGRPQDQGYSEGGRDPDYGLADTRMALVEARRAGVTPFCLTIDSYGQDYLAHMAGRGGYEVLTDIRRLPEILPHLYCRLTS